MSMKNRALLFLVGAAVVLGACGGGTPKVVTVPGGSTSGSGPSTTAISPENVHLYLKAGKHPSESAKMVCQQEARTAIASALGVTETSVTPPTWHDHVYSCAYVYPQGKVVLSVKELVSEATTSSYYDGILAKYGVIRRQAGLGQGAWLLKNNDVVVRKDYKVLLVDVSGIPQHFTGALTRADVSLNVAVVIMGCWSGA
jgi:hypothetical protein